MPLTILKRKLKKNKHILVHKTWAQECKRNLEKEYGNSEYCNNNTAGYLVSWCECGGVQT